MQSQYRVPESYNRYLLRKDRKIPEQSVRKATIGGYTPATKHF